jgi:hypothetical protein
MKLDISVEWLKAMEQDDISDPAPYRTNGDVAELARRKEERLRREAEAQAAETPQPENRKELVASK